MLNNPLYSVSHSFWRINVCDDVSATAIEFVITIWGLGENHNQTRKRKKETERE